VNTPPHALLDWTEIFAPSARQAFRIAVAYERDERFAYLAAQIPGATGITGGFVAKHTAQISAVV